MIFLKKKALILAVGLVVVCLAVTGCLLQKKKAAPENPVSPPPPLAYNLDLQAALEGRITRVPDAEGYFSVRLLVDGQEKTYKTKDAQLIMQLDTLQVLNLDADKAGILLSVSEPVQAKLADRYLVQQLEGKTLMLNTSIAFNGAQINLQLAENCVIRDIRGEAPAEAALQVMDEVLVYGDETGAATHIFLQHRELTAKLYWRVERKYDSKKKETSRQPDENGVYTILFAADGQQTELKCKDKDVVTQIDVPGSDYGAMGICVDEEGYIVQVQDVYKAVRGRELCSLYDVVSVDGDRFVAINNQDGNTCGKTLEGQVAPDCQIYNVSSSAYVRGEQVEALQPGDRITAYSDSMGLVKYVYLHTRIMDSPLYFNLDRMYQNSDTTRQPDENGWYVFRLASDGKVVTVKTQDRELVKKMDSYSSRGMGLLLDGDVVTHCFGPNCVTGAGLLSSGREVRELSSAMVTTGSGKSRVTPLMLHPDCKVYDVTGDPGTQLGEETQLRLGDKFYAFGTADEQATHIFVTQRAIPAE